MDHIAYTLLRPSVELSNHLHCVGHLGPKVGYPGGRHHVPIVWKEMVGRSHGTRSLEGMLMCKQDSPTGKAPHGVMA